MFRRRVVVLLAPTSSSAAGGDEGAACRVLGVEPNTPLSEVKRRFHELTQLHHPDMPNGDAGRFREINAAYRELRASHRHRRSEKMNASAQKSSFWSNTDYTDGEEDRRCYSRRGKKNAGSTGENKGAYGAQHRGFMYEVLWLYEGYEMALILGAAVVVLIIGFERFRLVRRATLERHATQKAMEEGLPPNMPLELDSGMMQMYNLSISPEVIKMDETIAKEMTYYRRATQRKFEDFREFLFIYDPDGVTSRKVSTARLAVQYVDEPRIYKCCPVVREFNSEDNNAKYESIAAEVAEIARRTPWGPTDAQFAVPLVAQGLAVIPMNSPNSAKWTFVEYKDTDKPTESPTCLLALRNLRFEKLGMCQRVTISGGQKLSPKLLKKRMEDIKNGMPHSAVVRGAPVPLKDTSIPLERMRL